MRTPLIDSGNPRMLTKTVSRNQSRGVNQVLSPGLERRRAGANPAASSALNCLLQFTL
jgi:hypothetical protein